MKNLTCGFIGLGLIGGSIAKALREKLPDTQIIAYDINEDPCTGHRRMELQILLPLQSMMLSVPATIFSYALLFKKMMKT